MKLKYDEAKHIIKIYTVLLNLMYTAHDIYIVLHMPAKSRQADIQLPVTSSHSLCIFCYIDFVLFPKDLHGHPPG